jgi:ethanolamine ammonia-lyase small subunit
MPPTAPYDDRRRHQEEHVDVRIGVTNSPKELEVILEDGTDGEAVRQHIDKVLAEGGTLWLTDRKGRQYGIPVEKVSFVEIGSSDASRRIGFGG